MYFTCLLDLLITFDQAGILSTRCTIDHKKEKPAARLRTSIQYGCATHPSEASRKVGPQA